MSNREMVIGENDYIEFLMRDKYSNNRRDEVARYKIALDNRGTVVIDLLRAWGMVAAKRGPDDASGRASLELLSVEETVNRAVEMTEAAFQAMEKHGMLIHCKRPETEEEE